MAILNKTEKDYINAVRKKLNSEKVKTLLQRGCNFSEGRMLRDEIGYTMTKDTIETSCRNLYQSTKGQVAFNNMFSNFSTSPSVDDVSDVRTVGAVDLSIVAMAQSLIPLVCVDRAMPNPEYTIYYTDLVAQNTAGGVTAGDVVRGNFEPANTDVNLGSVKTAKVTVTAQGVPTVDALGMVMPKSVKIDIIEDGAVVRTGQDFLGNGTIMFGDLVANASTITATINYETGAITFLNNLDVDQEIVISAKQDAIEANTVLTVVPRWTHLTLVSQPNFINLQNNLMNMAYMQRTHSVATGGTDNPYNNILFQQVKSTYIESINTMILRQLIASRPTADVSFTMSNYGTDKFSTTKDDLVCQLVANMQANLYARTNQPMTALIVNTNAHALLSQVAVQWEPIKNTIGLNGLMGYFGGIPVFRHNALDGITANTSTASFAEFIGVFKNSDNSSGSQVYGEFLPFTSTDVVQNFAKPTQYAQGFYSQVANQVVSPKLVVHGQVAVPVSLFSISAE